MTILTCDDPATARQYFGKYAGIVVDHGDLASAAGLTVKGRERGEICVDVPGILEEDANDPPAGADEQQQAPKPAAPKALRVVAKPSFMPGFFFIPEKGENVWVEFVAGDIDFPIWTGRWYPDKTSPATVAGKRPTRDQKVIRTASGHVVQLDDTKDGETVTVLHKGGAQITIDKDGSMLLANQKNAFLFMNAKDGETTLADEHGCFLTLKAEGAVVASKDGTLVEVKDGTVQVIAKNAVTLTAKDVFLKSASVSLGDGASQPAVLGTDFMTIFNTHVHATAMGPSGPPTPIPPNVFAPAPLGKGLSNSVKVGA